MRMLRGGATGAAANDLDAGLKKRRGRPGMGRGGRRGSGRQDSRGPRPERREGGGVARGGWMNDDDRKKAEARKARFAGAA